MGSRREPRTAYVNAHVGGRLRERRILLGFSQTRLGESLDLSFQQIQKYEGGTDRISVGRLVHLAEVLDVPITYFFEELSGLDESTPKVLKSALKSDKSDTIPADSMSTTETLELVRAYYQIEPPKLRKRVFTLIRSLTSREH